MRLASHTCAVPTPPLNRPVPLLRASHPEPAAAVTTVTALLCVGAGLDLPRAIGVTATVLASQLAIGWANDAIDATRDARVGRTDKPVAGGTVTRRAAAIAAVVASLACVVLALVTDAGAAPVAILALLSALSYNWPVKFTVFSPLPYAVSFASLPSFVVLVADRPVPAWLIAAGGLLGVGAHFANVVPDMADDERTGVRGLPHRFGPRGSLAVSAALLLAVTALLIFGPPGPPRLAGAVAGAFAVAVLLVGAYFGRRSSARHWAFRGVMGVALVDVVLLVAGGVLG
jgi:4-hydroxybenzoate polyprenyltransferase